MNIEEDDRSIKGSLSRKGGSEGLRRIIQTGRGIDYDEIITINA